MALNVASLISGIRNVFAAQNGSTDQIARKIARVYFDYAKLAQAPPGTPVILKGSEMQILQQAILSVMRGRYPAPQAAQSIGNGVAAFWMSPPVATGAGGVVTAVVPQSGISRMMAVSVTSSAQSALSMAQALDLITRTAFVTHSPPLPSGPLF